jgi:hypothetical protein
VRAWSAAALFFVTAAWLAAGAPAKAAPAAPIKTKLACQGSVITLIHDGSNTKVFDANETHTLVDARPRRLSFDQSVCKKVKFTAPAVVKPTVWNRSDFMGVDCSFGVATTIWILRYPSAVIVRAGGGGKAYVFDQQGSVGTSKPRTGWNTTRCRPIGT